MACEGVLPHQLEPRLASRTDSGEVRLLFSCRNCEHSLCRSYAFILLVVSVLLEKLDLAGGKLARVL